MTMDAASAPPAPPAPAGMPAAEWTARLDLACCYRLFDLSLIHI